MTKWELREYRALQEEKSQLKEMAIEQNSQINEEMYKEKLKECEKKILEIEKSIKSLPSEYRMIMRAYYIRGQTWEEIAEKKGYCVKQIQRKHRHALQMLE